MIIDILKEKIDIRFNMAVEIAYEEIAGEAFSLESLNKTKNTIALDMAAIIAANPDTQITVDRLLTEASGPEISALDSAVIQAMLEWLEIPKVIAEGEAKQPPTDESEDTAKKN